MKGRSRRVASGTVRDLASSIAGDRVFEPTTQDDLASEAEDETSLDDSAAFEDMLGAVLDESTELENLTLESLFDTTRELPGALGTGVVPAWLRETEKFIREPSFLAEMREALPTLDLDDAFGETTAPAVESLATPADSLEATVDASADVTKAIDARDAAPLRAPVAAAESETSPLPISSRNDDPLLAQLAVTMTQMMTDLTADATVLTRDNQIVAYSGSLALETFRALRRAIEDDWKADSDASRIRYINLPAGGRDYMLYSRGSVAEHTLTMIFAGGRQLREIRQQGDRMLRALDAAPEREAREEARTTPQPPEARELRQPFAFVWMVDDPKRLLQKPVAEQLVFWLEVQLNGLNWRIQRLDVHRDFIYLCADVPGSASPDALGAHGDGSSARHRLRRRSSFAARPLGGRLSRPPAGARHERAGIAALPAIRPRLIPAPSASPPVRSPALRLYSWLRSTA